MNNKAEFYNKMIKIILTDSKLKLNGYPQPHPDKQLMAIICNPPTYKCTKGEGETRYCARCGTTFSLAHYNLNQYRSCQYHRKYICCGHKNLPGCQFANYHVHEWLNFDELAGFIRLESNTRYNFIPSDEDIFAVDCEMLYTTDGMEVARVTVVDINLKTVYDELIKPDTKIVDYNTVYSGITEATLANVTKRLSDVHRDLKKIFNASTILIGHSLENDFKYLKIVHDKIIDTSILYPHPDPSRKQPLKYLCTKLLHRSIQKGGTSGHDSTEDAEVCISLVKLYLQNRH